MEMCTCILYAVSASNVGMVVSSFGFSSIHVSAENLLVQGMVHVKC